MSPFDRAQTDRRTDGRTDTRLQQRPRLRIASRDKNSFLSALNTSFVYVVIYRTYTMNVRSVHQHTLSDVDTIAVMYMLKVV